MRTLFAPVTLYTQPNCAPCRRVKELLEAEGIEFDAVDITQNDEAYTYVTQVLKAAATPVIVTDTHEPIIGNRQDELEELISYYTASETGV
ncbi:thioredoxin [Mycobacterium phage Bachome]|nr:thioredoxin [Mycobacterium phage Bachome]UXE05103.1 thioredoxin [Mycobacterium phage MaCh]